MNQVGEGEAKFRFEDLQIWKDSITITKNLIVIGNELENKKFYRFSEQLRAAALSISNNIAEGSGSTSDKEFAQFLNIARRSVFECVNILIIMHETNMLEDSKLLFFKIELNNLSKKITNFRRAILK
jgi:four helix bundle protein